MYNEKLAEKADNLISLIKEYWDENVLVADTSFPPYPFDAFNLRLILYGKFHVVCEYERSTLGFYLQEDDTLIGLSKIAAETVYKGFDSYRTKDNILHNIKVLDGVLKTR